MVKYRFSGVRCWHLTPLKKKCREENWPKNILFTNEIRLLFVSDASILHHCSDSSSCECKHLTSLFLACPMNQTPHRVRCKHLTSLLPVCPMKSDSSSCQMQASDITVARLPNEKRNVRKKKSKHHAVSPDTNVNLKDAFQHDKMNAQEGRFQHNETLFPLRIPYKKRI